MNNQTPRKGGNLKKEKHTDRHMVAACLVCFYFFFKCLPFLGVCLFVLQSHSKKYQYFPVFS